MRLEGFRGDRPDHQSVPRQAGHRDTNHHRAAAGLMQVLPRPHGAAQQLPLVSTGHQRYARCYRDEL